MAEITKIEWASHTFNSWVGCTKVSPGCANCYAEADFDHRKGFATWGAKGTRVVTSDANWKKPVGWNNAAWWCERCKSSCFELKGTCRGCGSPCRRPVGTAERPRVFCASLADVFEGPETMPADAVPVIDRARARLFRLIHDTPNLDWLLLTKRPQNFARTLRAALDTGLLKISETKRGPVHWDYVDWLHGRVIPKNIWLGTSVENQAAADERIPQLLRIPAAVRFLSCEPLLGPVDLSKWLACGDGTGIGNYGFRSEDLHWVIAGGESGPDARPVHPDWVRSLRDQCTAAGVAFFFKQWGEHLPNDHMEPDERIVARDTGKPWTTLDAGLSLGTYRVGKKNAGRLLDGREWNELPEVRA